MMIKELEYPFDAEYILKKKKSIKKTLLNEPTKRIKKKIAILGGSTTNDVKLMLELFLLNYGIEPEFYESEYNQYYEDAMFPNKELDNFEPDIIYIHTSNRNISAFPQFADSAEEIEIILDNEMARYKSMWDRLETKYHSPIIQNNFELPAYRLLGNRDAYDLHGKVYFISRLNMEFSRYAQTHDSFYINDINYLSASYGLDKWSDSFYWHMYKYACAVPAIPYLSFNIAKIIKSIYGKNKKGLVLDLDNTLWGGVIGDDGVENISIGMETSVGQAFYEFQSYVKEHSKIGILLNINSKNDYQNAIEGLKRPDSVLQEDDFVVIKANWENKDINFKQIADELNLLPESLVFIDDNPAEREIVKSEFPEVSTPIISNVEEYISIIDKSGFFEATNLSTDDLNRTEMYKENAQRNKFQSSFASYNDYLLSLDMHAVIRPFEDIYISRIAQLINKSNQFNLTTKRYSQAEVQQIAENNDYYTLYGKLSDKFGDNGIVSVVICKKEAQELQIELLLMSCRVLKRDMEYAMMDALISYCIAENIPYIRGYYYPTAKNAMVRDFYQLQGFTKVSEDTDGNTEWILEISNRMEQKNKVIEVESQHDTGTAL